MLLRSTSVVPLHSCKLGLGPLTRILVFLRNFNSIAWGRLVSVYTALLIELKRGFKAVRKTSLWGSISAYGNGEQAVVEAIRNV
ncbi:hypothetical protein Tco_1304086 [Tanacetum coccineum]